MVSSKLERLYKILIVILIIFLLESMLNSTYVAIWKIYSLGMEPLYGLWLQSFIPNLLLIFLLLKRKLQLFGLLADFLMDLASFIFLHQTSSANPIA